LIDTTGGKRFFAKLCLEVSFADFSAVHDERANDGYRFTAFADTFEGIKR
jgi:hypothetical protein